MELHARIGAIMASKVEPTARLLLMVIAHHIGTDSGICWVGPDALAVETGLARSSVDEWLRDLERAGIIRRWWGEHRSKDMAIDWSALAEASPESSKRGGKRSPKIGNEVPNIGGAEHRGEGHRTSVPDAPNIGGHLPNIGGGPGTEHRYDGYRTSVRTVPNIGTKGTEHRTRTVQEPSMEPSMEPLGHTASGGPTKANTPADRKPSADTPYRRRVSDAFGEAFTEVFGVRYPWVFRGKYHDGHRVNVWIEAAKIKESDPEPGLQRLRGAALAYCRAVDAGRVFPYEEKANTQRFTVGIVTWLQTDPGERPRPKPRTAAEERQRTLDGLDAAIAEAKRRENATC